jgi:hypothetical protein
MSTFTIKQDARGPALQATLTTGAGTPQDLTGGTVTFYMERLVDGLIKINGGAVTVVSPTLGTVSYAWGATDTDTAGVYRAEFHVTGLSPTPVRFPSGSYITVVVLPKVA